MTQAQKTINKPFKTNDLLMYQIDEI